MGYGHEENNLGFVKILIGIGLLIYGVLYINSQMQFLALEVDLQSSTSILLSGALCVLGGIILVFGFLARERRY